MDMKKTYETPVFYLEEFTLNQAIAKNCGDSTNDRITATQGDYNVCGIAIDVNNSGAIDAGDQFVFLQSTQTCAVFKIMDGETVTGVILGKAVDSISSADEAYEQYCYNNPVNGIKMFNS